MSINPENKAMIIPKKPPKPKPNAMSTVLTTYRPMRDVGLFTEGSIVFMLLAAYALGWDAGLVFMV